MARSTAHLLDTYLAGCPPFCWRSHHCLAYISNWLALVEGDAPLVPVVSGPFGYRNALHRLGVDLGSYITMTLQRRPMPPARAWPGDVLLVVQGRCQALAICTGRTAAGITPAGVQHAPLQAAVHAWPVGRGCGA